MVIRYFIGFSDFPTGKRRISAYACQWTGGGSGLDADESLNEVTCTNLTVVIAPCPELIHLRRWYNLVLCEAKFVI
jgi:hypothetical protein